MVVLPLGLSDQTIGCSALWTLNKSVRGRLLVRGRLRVRGRLLVCGRLCVRGRLRVRGRLCVRGRLSVLSSGRKGQTFGLSALWTQGPYTMLFCTLALPSPLSRSK